MPHGSGTPRMNPDAEPWDAAPYMAEAPPRTSYAYVIRSDENHGHHCGIGMGIPPCVTTAILDDGVARTQSITLMDAATGWITSSLNRPDSART